MKTFLKITFVLAMIIALPTTTPLSAMQDTDPGQKAVLITGTSSGFGRASTELLSAKGYFVYAGVLNSEEAKIWADNPNVKALILDVTKPSDIAAAVKVVEAEGRGLYGLVNNAGILVVGVMTEMPEEEFDRQLDVNLYGPYRITKAFAPLIIAAKGRITNVSSVSGIQASATWGAYSISKHGLEAYSDTLSAELTKFDVSVSLIEPGAHSTNIGAAMINRLRDKGQTFESSAYKEEIDGTLNWADKIMPRSGDPMDVVRAIEASLFEENPKNRYLVVSSQQGARGPIKQLMREAIELNQRHQFSFTEKELNEILKEVVAEQ
ncbi:MAG: SDR family NAD(P)-dependent oxidoreductase [Kordiimonadaceae bacterium]|jgi:NAD(P)-dependent dehydrogenase (short-subunit alcohol dehydrogenase family)|nr:SDR family NAD(P)-dependent oxidoreductase [Kordiimonadaceae bacterium]